MSLGPMQAVFSTLDLLRKQENAGFEDAQARKKAKWDDEDRAVKMEEVTRAKKLREELENEAKPVEVETVEADGPVRPAGITDKDGNALTPEAQPTMARVGGKTYVNQNEAGAAAETHNVPGAVMQRQSRRLLQAGNPQAAATLAETGMKLDAQMSADIDRRFNEDVERNVTNWDAAAKFATQSAFDGGAGQIQYRFAEMPDGTMQPQVSVDGQNWQSDPKGRSYKKDATGFQEAKLDLLRIPTDKKLAHLYGRAKAEAEAKNDQEKLKLDERRTKAYETSVANQGAAAMVRATRGRGGSGDGDSDGDGTPDSVNMGEIDKVVDDYLATKDENGKVSAPADPELRRAVRALAGNFRESLTDPAGAAMRAVKMYREALASSGNDVKQAMQRVAIALDVERNGGGGHQIQLGGPGAKVESYGVDAKAGPGKLPAKPATGAMAQLMAQDAAKAKAKADAEAQVRATREAEAAAAAQMTLEQIRALNPDEAFRLLNSPAGRQLDPRVRAILEAQAIGNTVAPNRIGPKL